MAKSPKKKSKAATAEKRPTFPPIYIGEWIAYLGRRQVEVAERAGMSESQLSLVITGQRQYIQGKLEAIANELGIERIDLFRPPTENPDWISLGGLNEAERVAALNVISGFKTRK